MRRCARHKCCRKIREHPRLCSVECSRGHCAVEEPESVRQWVVVSGLLLASSGQGHATTVRWWTSLHCVVKGDALTEVFDTALVWENVDVRALDARRS
eukprot:3681286-Pyramimonas_sp.AAC.1